VSKIKKGAPKKRSAAMLWVGGVAVAAVAMLIGMAVMSNQKPVTKAQSDAELGVKGYTRGPDTAPVKVVEYADFLCHYCSDAQKVLEPQLAPYIERGEVQFTYHYVLNWPEVSTEPALAAECAAEQGYFWAYKNTIYDHFNANGYGKGDLKDWAKRLGLNTQQFNACLDSSKYKEKLSGMTQEAKTAGVKATPTFTVNGQLIEGPDPKMLLQYIDQLVQQSKTK